MSTLGGGITTYYNLPKPISVVMPGLNRAMIYGSVVIGLYHYWTEHLCRGPEDLPRENARALGKDKHTATLIICA